MVVALLTLLGVPIWLTLGWLASALWHRRDIQKNFPDLIKMKVRLIEGSYRHIDGNYSRIAALAIWAHDILIIEKGLFLARNLHFAIADGIQPPQPADPKQVKGLGDKPVTMQFLLDNGAIIEVAAPGEILTLAQGPFFPDSGKSINN
jgi:hypothetical protein